MEVPGKRFDLDGCDDDINTPVKIYCEPCEINARKQLAKSYCVECNEFICDGCERTHRGSKISRHHNILDQKSMPTQKLLFVDENFCPKHSGKLLEHYCQNHSEFACGVCVNLVHKQCGKIDLIKDAAADFKNSSAYKELLDTLRELAKKFLEGIVRAEKSIESAKMHFDRTVSAIRAFRTDLNSILDSLEEKALKDAEEQKRENINALEEVKVSCQSFQSEIDTASTDIENSLKYEQSQQFLMMTKQAQTQAEKYTNTLKQINSNIDATHMTFKGDDRLLSALRSFNSLGILQQSDQCEKKVKEFDKIRYTVTEKDRELSHANDSFKKVMKESSENIGDARATETTLTEMKQLRSLPAKDPRKWRANFAGEIYVNLKQDKTNCYITSGVEICNGRVVLVDHNNCCLKNLNTTTGAVSLLLKLQVRPWDIILYRGYQYILSSENKLLFLNIEETTRIDREMQVEGDCRGIAYLNNTFILSCAAPNPCVKMLDIDGNTLCVIDRDLSGQPLFANPWYLRTSPDQKHVLISDFEKHKVTSMDVNGHVTSQYVDRNLRGPTGLAIDFDGFVYLAGRKSHNVHMISGDCKQVQILLPRRVGEELPQSIIWCKGQGKLYVGHNWRTRICNTLSVYEIQ